MESNKDEAERCVKIAESALASGDKQKALKFIKIAKRLDQNLPLDALIDACEKLGNHSSEIREEILVDRVSAESVPRNSPNSERNYTEENIRLIREIKKNKDYYRILGVEKSCSVEEIRKTYRKLSLKVHPDKNKAPGAEEAFKSVCKAFKCLSDEQSRRNYDQVGLVEDYEFNERRGNVAQRRRRTGGNGFFEEDFDPDEIFRSFFFGAQNDHAQRVYRARTMGRQHGENYAQGVGRGGGGGSGGGSFNLVTLAQILPLLLFFLMALIPSSEPQYSLQKTYTHQIAKVTEKYGIEYFVKSEDFEQQFPVGSSAKKNLEHSVLRDYRSVLSRYCLMERQRRQWYVNYPTPYCEKLRNLEVA